MGFPGLTRAGRKRRGAEEREEEGEGRNECVYILYI